MLEGTWSLPQGAPRVKSGCRRRKPVDVQIRSRHLVWPWEVLVYVGVPAGVWRVNVVRVRSRKSPRCCLSFRPASGRRLVGSSMLQTPSAFASIHTTQSSPPVLCTAWLKDALAAEEMDGSALRKGGR